MTDFAYFADKGPPGTHLCALCYEYVSIDDLFVDEEGSKWDVCNNCHLGEVLVKDIAELKSTVLGWLSDLPVPENQTDYAKGQAKALNEVLKLVTPQPRTPEDVVEEIIGSREKAKVVVGQLRREEFLE